MNDIKLGDPKYSKKCSYILQDDNLYPFFTVHESMMLAANLKIADMSTDEKNLIVSNKSDNLFAAPIIFVFGEKKHIILKLNENHDIWKKSNRHFRCTHQHYIVRTLPFFSLEIFTLMLYFLLIDEVFTHIKRTFKAKFCC